MIDGVEQILPKQFIDDRGVVMEIFREFPVMNTTETISEYGVLRGFHVQEWDKIVYPSQGEVYMVFLDARRDSPTYGEKMIDFVNDDNRKAYLIPKGVANLYCTLSDDVHYIYFNSESYDEKRTHGIAYNDPQLEMIYPVVNPKISEKDRNNPLFKDFKLKLL